MTGKPASRGKTILEVPLASKAKKRKEIMVRHENVNQARKAPDSYCGVFNLHPYTSVEQFASELPAGPEIPLSEVVHSTVFFILSA